MPTSAATLIPRRVLFGNPDRTAVRTSPDGRQLSFLAPVDGVLNVWVGPADDPAAARPVTRDTHRGIRTYTWAHTSRHVLYVQDRNGDENWRLFVVDLDSGVIRDLTPIDGIQARIQAVSDKSPEEILVALNDRDASLHDLHRLNLLTGRRTLVQTNPGFAGFETDDRYRVRFAERITADGGQEILRPTTNGQWEVFDRIGADDAMTSGLSGLDAEGRTLYVTDSRGRDTAAFYAVDTATGRRELLAEDPGSDVSGTLRHPVTKRVQAVSFTRERRRWSVLDPELGAELEHLRTVCDGDLDVTSRSADDRVWIVAYVFDNAPTRFYRYERASRTATFLFTQRRDLEGLPLARMHPITLRARDGLELVCYLTLPVGTDAPHAGRPAQPLPMVLLVHGGPWWRDHWGYHAQHQWLANRGYAVLSVNYRGSTGFGKGFINAARRQWSRDMHNDLLDAVAWAVAEGVADPARVAIMGGSYGGYATLVGLTFTPDTFACGVDIVGPSNLVTLLETVPPYWKPALDLWLTRVGDPRTEEGRAFLQACSPLGRADRIRRPLLIGQGANDPRVKQAESDQIVRAMQAAHIPVTYVLFPDEGHGFARPENSMAFNAIAEAFLARCLGGRCEPIGEDFRGSSLTVPAGADVVPGVTEALDAARAPTRP